MVAVYRLQEPAVDPFCLNRTYKLLPKLRLSIRVSKVDGCCLTCVPVADRFTATRASFLRDSNS